MITGTGAGAIPGTIDLTHLARIACNNLLGTIDGFLLAGANLGKCWFRILACWTGRTCGGFTALETSWTRTEIAHSGAAALRSPAAVATAAAGRFGAAFDVVGKSGASAGDKGSTFRSTFLGRNAHSRSRPFAGALAVQDRSLSNNVGTDSAKPEKSRNEEDGEAMHSAV